MDSKKNSRFLTSMLILSINFALIVKSKTDLIQREWDIKTRSLDNAFGYSDFRIIIYTSKSKKGSDNILVIYIFSRITNTD